MHLLAVIFGIALLPKAYTLKCYECPLAASESCTNVPKDCSSQSSQCSAMRLLSYEGSSKVQDLSTKSCALAEVCVEGSFNLGQVRDVIATKCCSTDLCNNQPVPEPSRPVPNGKKCYTCNGANCNGTLNCEGTEDYCIEITATAGGAKVTMKGCASKIFCSNTKSALLTRTIETEVACCQGDYCNSASSTSAGLLLLVAPIYLVLFS